jgi:hypothetical protein
MSTDASANNDALKPLSDEQLDPRYRASLAERRERRRKDELPFGTLNSDAFNAAHANFRDAENAGKTLREQVYAALELIRELSKGAMVARIDQAVNETRDYLVPLSEEKFAVAWDRYQRAMVELTLVPFTRKVEQGSLLAMFLPAK